MTGTVRDKNTETRVAYIYHKYKAQVKPLNTFEIKF